MTTTERTAELGDGAQGAEPPPLRISRVFHAPRATVFAAWASAESLKRWFSPKTYTTPDARVEMVVGGAFEVCMRSPGGQEHWSRGVFREVVPNERLVIEMRAEGQAGETLFTALTEVTFSDALAGTRMDVVQSYRFADPAIAAPMVAGAAEGWRTTLEKLEREVIRLRGGDETGARSVVHAQFDLERLYPAPAARVWAALTEPGPKARWFGGTPGEWELLERAMDVRPGGRERVRGRWQSGVVSTFDASYLDVVAGERLVYAYEMHLDEKKISVSLATMQLVARGEETLLKVTEQGAFLDGFDDAGSRELGTGILLDRLGASLAG